MSDANNGSSKNDDASRSLVLDEGIEEESSLCGDSFVKSSEVEWPSTELEHAQDGKPDIVLLKFPGLHRSGMGYDGEPTDIVWSGKQED
ncbi:MAG: hypothetical protein R3F22_02505 [Lysobacteraceae bacterium]